MLSNGVVMLLMSQLVILALGTEARSQTQVSTSCISKNVIGQTPAGAGVGTVTVEIANQCGQCLVLDNWAITLDGKVEFLYFDPKKLEASEATNVTIYLNRLGTYDVTIWKAVSC